MSTSESKQVAPADAVVAAPSVNDALTSAAGCTDGEVSADRIRVMDLGSLSAADSSASLNMRRRSHTRGSAVSYVNAWQSQQALDHFSRKAMTSMGSSAASSPREVRPRAVSSSAPHRVEGHTTVPARSLRDVYCAQGSVEPLPGFPTITRMALKLAGTAEKDAVTRTAMSAFQRWRRLPLVRTSLASATAPQPGTMRESTVSSLFTSLGNRGLPGVTTTMTTSAATLSPSTAAPRLPAWRDPTAGSLSLPLAVGTDQRPPANVGRRPSSERGTGTSSAGISGNATSSTPVNGAQRRVTPRGVQLRNSYSDASDGADERATSSNLVPVSHNASGDAATIDHCRSPSHAEPGVVSPTQPVISLLHVHSRRATPLHPCGSSAQISRSGSARSGPSLAVGDEGMDDFHRRWEEEGLSMSDRIEDLVSIEEDHRHSTTEKERRRRARILARYTRASDALFMGALKVSTGSRLHPSLASSAVNTSLDAQDTPSDDNLSFWAAVSLGVGYNQPACQTSGSSVQGGGSGSEAALSARSAAAAAAASAGLAGGGSHSGSGVGPIGSAVPAMAIPKVVSQRAAPAPLPLAPTPRQSAPRHVDSASSPDGAVPHPHLHLDPLAGAVTPDAARGSSTTGPLEDSLASSSVKQGGTAAGVNGAPAQGESVAGGSEDGLEDVTLSAVTISCNNSLNSTRNNALSAAAACGVSAAPVPTGAASPPKPANGASDANGPATHVQSVRKVPPRMTSATVSAPTPERPRAEPTTSSPPPPPPQKSRVVREPIGVATGHTDEDESISSSTLRATITTKQPPPPRSLPTSMTNRRVRPLVDKPQSNARQELEEALRLGGSGEGADAEPPTREATQAVERGARAVQDQQRRYLRHGFAPSMTVEACSTASTHSPTGADKINAPTPPSTSVVARRRRESPSTLGEPLLTSPSLLATPAVSRRVSLASPLPASAATEPVSPSSRAALLDRDAFQEKIRAPEKEARHTIIIDYRAGLLDILRECHFLSNSA